MQLEAVLKWLQEKGLTLNKCKCEFNKRKLEFFGYVFSEDGLSADPKKCEVIKTAPAQQTYVVFWQRQTMYHVLLPITL